MATIGKIERYHEPDTLAEAVAAAAQGPTTVVAGGTLIVRESQPERLTCAPSLLNLQRVEELRGITSSDDGIRIGALTSIRDILDHAELATRATVLIRTASQMASSQVRNLGTVGGNLCWASPSADLAVPLLALNATVELATWNGESTVRRSLDLRKFLVGKEKTALRDGEILTATTIPASALSLRGGFQKSGTRVSLDTTLASAGIVAAVAGGMLANVRVAFGGVAATTMRAESTERTLANQRLSDELITDAVAVARAEIDPSDDERASAWYRRELIGVFLKRLLNELRNA